MRSTTSQLQELKSSNAWEDLRLVILTRLSSVRNDLEFQPLDSPELESAYLRGRAAELRFIADLPEELLSQIERGELKWDQKEQEEEPDKLEEQELRELEQEESKPAK